MGDRRVVRGGRVVVVALALGLLEGCSGSSAGSGSGGGSGGLFEQDGVKVAEAEAEAEADAGATAEAGAEAPGSAGAPSTEPKVESALCAAVIPLLLPPDDLAEHSEFGQLSDVDQRALIDRVGEMIPDDLDADWAAMGEWFDYVKSGQELQPPGLETRLKEMYEVAIPWAREQCPDAAPSQRCWALAGEPYYDTPLPTAAELTALAQRKGMDPPALAASPTDVIDRDPDHAEAVELDRTDTEVLYGWLDEDGFVIRTQEVGRTSDRAGWVLVHKRACTS